MKKKNYIICLVLLFVLSFLSTGFMSVGTQRIMMQMESQSLQGGKTATMTAELFYQSLDGKLITRLDGQINKVMITNRFGELTVYDPEKNTVFRAQSFEYSSQNNLIFFFLSGKTHDLGLGDMGFRQQQTEFKDGLMISQWMSPSSLNHLISHVELVHEDYVPIYAGYYDASGELVRKVYYSDYEYYFDLALPTILTEFNYLATGDSIINRVRFSNIRLNRQAVSSWFDFEIPDDAQIIDY